MPIIKRETLSMERHVLPVLRAAGYRLEQTCELDWLANGQPVAICNGSDLWTRDEAIAKLLLERCRPFGQELTIYVAA